MASAAEIASLITQGTQPPQGNQDVSYHTGVVKSWDPTSGVNSVEVNGVILSNLTALQSGMGNAYLAGDVVSVIRVQTKYTILGRMSAPGGLTGGSPISLTGGDYDLEGLISGSWTNIPTGPSFSIRVGNACLVAFGGRSTVRNAGIEVSLQMQGPANAQDGDFQGLSVFSAMNNNATNGPILDIPFTKQLMFYKNSVWNSNGQPQLMVPGVYTFSLRAKWSDYSGGNSSIRDVVVRAPWLTVLPF